jgi:transposase
MEKLPEVERLSASEKDALITALWAEVPRLKARLSVLEATPHEPRKDAHHASVPPSHPPKANLPAAPRTGTRREASVGRAGGGRPLHPDPDPVIIAPAKTCPHCGGAVQAHEQHPHAVYDKIELPPIKPVVTRVEQHAGQCPPCGPSSVAPVPVGMEPGTPFGASIESLALYRRYTHAISYARLAALFTQMCGVPISAGALAHLFQRANTRLGDRVAEILTRRRSSRLICSDETGARVNGHTPWEGVLQHTEVCVHVIRSSRGHGVIRDMLGDHRPTIWVSDRYRAQRHHPAEAWQVCLAHQLRDGQCALEAGDTVFAPRMKAVLLRAFAMHKRRDTLATSTLYQYRCDLQRRLDRC